MALQTPGRGLPGNSLSHGFWFGDIGHHRALPERGCNVRASCPPRQPSSSRKGRYPMRKTQETNAISLGEGLVLTGQF